MLSDESKKAMDKGKGQWKGHGQYFFPPTPHWRESVEKWVATEGNDRGRSVGPVGMQSLVTQITKAAEEYGEGSRPIDVISVYGRKLQRNRV